MAHHPLGDTWQTAAWRLAQGLGVVLIVAGLIPVVHTFVQFAKAGGTPMPAAPTQRLVVNGFNRFVRNPMYVGLLLAIVGQALSSSAASACCLTPHSDGSRRRHSYTGTRNPPSAGNSIANTRHTGVTCLAGCPACVRGSLTLSAKRVS
jgi:Phospholipid methyltransferase